VAVVAIFPNFNAEQRAHGFTDFNDLASQEPEIVSRQLDEVLQRIKEQEAIVITYPTADELAASTMAYAAKKKRYFSEFRSAMPILIAIGLKQRPETSEVEEFRSAFRLLDGEEEQRIVRTTVEMLKRFDNDQAVAAAEKEFEQAPEIESAFHKDYDGLDGV
jgi:hypothetical protein